MGIQRLRFGLEGFFFACSCRLHGRSPPQDMRKDQAFCEAQDYADEHKKFQAMAGDMATSLLGTTASPQRSQALRAGFALALVGSGVLMGIAMERAGATAAIALTSR